MKALPILFSGPMVRALLDGRKTQTRRLFKVYPGDKTGITSPREEVLTMEDGSFHYLSIGGMSGPYPCPYGVPGGLLWVRESIFQPNAGGFIYRANWREQATADGYDNIPADECAVRWTPSIHMPRRASRLTLEIAEVRVQRLNDCTEEDALAEGVVFDPAKPGFWVPGVDHPNKDFPYLARATAREMYAALWDTINGSGAWLGNPWVWAVSFKVHQQNVDALLREREAA